MDVEMAGHEYKIIIKGPGLSFDQPVDKSAVNKIISFVMTGSASLGSDQGRDNLGASAANANSGTPASGLKPKDFIAQKKPLTQYERIACLAHYLATVRNVTEFGAKEITAINKEAAQQPIGNIAQVMGDTASKYGYVSAAGGGKKQMTARGEDLVGALPNREAVKAALADHRPPKKRRPRAKKK
jgi:hypothetical protein